MAVSRHAIKGVKNWFGAGAGAGALPRNRLLEERVDAQYRADGALERSVRV